MPKAEVGSTKYIANKMKAKGLQRLRWYCQICEKQCRDENGFKQHTMSEGHVRAMLLVGEDPKKFINDYSNQFKRDFLQLLKTAHGEKKVHMNNFYQEYIRDKEHIHMNSTKWPSLTEFAKYLGKEGLCKVEEGDRGLEIQFIDDSPDAIRRREDILNKEKRAKGDEEIELKLLERQIKNAQMKAEEDAKYKKQMNSALPENMPLEPAKVKLGLGSFSLQKGSSSKASSTSPPRSMPPSDAFIGITSFSALTSTPRESETPPAGTSASPAPRDNGQWFTPEDSPAVPAPAKPKMSLAGLSKGKPTNPLMAKRKKDLNKSASFATSEPEKKMSNAERIMKEEMERKRTMDEKRGNGLKRQKVG